MIDVVQTALRMLGEYKASKGSRHARFALNKKVEVTVSGEVHSPGSAEVRVLTSGFTGDHRNLADHMEALTKAKELAMVLEAFFEQAQEEAMEADARADWNEGLGGVAG